MSTAAVPAPEQVTLRDGSSVVIRPIRPEDAPRLQAFVKRLSQDTMFFRYLGHMKTKSDEQARRLTNVDYDTRMAFVALTPALFGPNEGEDILIGDARYFPVESGEEGVAEVAIVVQDEYQGHGLGSLLLIRLLRYAVEHGYKTIQAAVHTENEPILRFIRKSGLPLHIKLLESGVYDIRLDLVGDIQDAVLGRRKPQGMIGDG